MADPLGDLPRWTSRFTLSAQKPAGARRGEEQDQNAAPREAFGGFAAPKQPLVRARGRCPLARAPALPLPLWF